MRQLVYAGLLAILSVTFIACAISLAQCDTHAWTDSEIAEQPCIRTYRTIYPSDYLAAAALGVPVRNFHCWCYDLSHVYCVPPAYLLPSVPGHEDDVKARFSLPMFPGHEEADQVPELKPQED